MISGIVIAVPGWIFPFLSFLLIPFNNFSESFTLCVVSWRCNGRSWFGRPLCVYMGYYIKTNHVQTTWAFGIRQRCWFSQIRANRYYNINFPYRLIYVALFSSIDIMKLIWFIIPFQFYRRVATNKSSWENLKDRWIMKNCE